jgi:hypothetical protein
MKRLALLLAGSLLCVAAVYADGPETGTVSGIVTDSSGSAVPGVTVILEGDRGQAVVLTEADGTYRFGLVRPGSYTLSTQLEGFLPQRFEVAVDAGGKAVVDVKLALGTSEEITVTSEAPMVDKFNVAVGGSVKAETVQEVAPVNRGIYGSINLLPGVANDQESVDLSSSRPSFNGTQWQESAVFIDGVDTTFVRYGATRMFLPNTATTQVNLQTSGSGADYGRFVGGVTNVIVKSGTNRFHGELTGIYQNLEWDANFDPHPELEQNPVRPRAADFFVLSDEERNVDQLNYEIGFGGPIRRDKAWFFVASSEFSTFTRDRTLAGDLIDQSTDSESYIAKLNFQPASQHSLAASWIATPITRLFQLDSFSDQYVPTMHDIGGSLATANWNWSINSSFFLETKIAHHTSSEDKLLNPCLCTDPQEALALKQQDPRFAPTPELAGQPFSPVNNFDAYLDNADGTWHNGWLLDNGFGTNEYPRDQANVGITQFVGANHELKYGIDWQETEWEQDVRRTNFFTGTGFQAHSRFGFAIPTAWLNYNPADVVAEGRGSGTANADNFGYYVRDRFTVGDHWTFNLGLRLEDQTHENDIGRTVIDSADLSPRATAVYDVSGNGRMLFSLSAGRYHTHIPQELINTYLLDRWNGFNAHDRFFYVAALGGYRFPIGGTRPGAMWKLVDQGVLDIDIDPYGRDEVILGWEWQFSNNWATKVRGIAWETFDQIGSVTQLGPDGRLIELTENVADLPQVMRDYGWIDLFVADGRGTVADAERALAAVDDARREYRGIQIELNRRFNNNWSLFSNLTLARTEGNSFGSSAFNNTGDDYGEQLHLLVTELDIAECVRRNAEVRSASAQADCGALAQFIGQPISLVNRFGDANRERPVIFKVYGNKVWELGRHSFTLGGLFNYESGVTWSLSQPGRETAGTGGNTALDSTATLYVEERGRRDIGGHAWTNLSGAWGFPVNSKLRGELRLEVTNVTDRQDLIGVSGNDGRPLQSKRSWSQPRKMRLLASFRF